jgi:hypothetical protein
MRRSKRWVAFAVVIASFLSGGAHADSFRGVVRAPPGESRLGKVIVAACWAPQRRCEQRAPQTRAKYVESRTESAEFELVGLEPGLYFVVATVDLNGSGREDPGDWTGDVLGPDGTPIAVQSGSTVVVQMRQVGAPLPTPKPAPAPAPPATVSRPTAPAPPAPPKPGGMSGLYHGLKRSLVAPGPGSLVEKGITWVPTRDWFALLPDGRAIVGLPEEGLKAPIDWSQCGNGFLYCPTYSVKGKQVVVRWPTGEERVYTRRADGKALVKDGLDYVELPPLDGRKLDGRYVSVGNEYRKGWISFRQDGRFEERGLLPDIDWREIGSSRELTERERNGGSGSYAIERNTLELRYSDGRVVRTSVYALPESAKQPRPPTLYFRSWDFHLHP